MRIGELARSVDVSVETIRYYQRIGLLELPQKPYGGIRSYGSRDLRGSALSVAPSGSDSPLRIFKRSWSFRAPIASKFKRLRPKS